MIHVTGAAATKLQELSGSEAPVGWTCGGGAPSSPS
jgi:hypothetical protein